MTENVCRAVVVAPEAIHPDVLGWLAPESAPLLSVPVVGRVVGGARSRRAPTYRDSASQVVDLVDHSGQLADSRAHASATLELDSRFGQDTNRPRIEETK